MVGFGCGWHATLLAWVGFLLKFAVDGYRYPLVFAIRCTCELGRMKIDDLPLGILLAVCVYPLAQQRTHLLLLSTPVGYFINCHFKALAIEIDEISAYATPDGTSLEIPL